MKRKDHDAFEREEESYERKYRLPAVAAEREPAIGG